jgi:hypothetical protein
MKKLILAALVGGLPMLALAATWENVPLVDRGCAEKVKAEPDSHTTACLLQCASSGYGIFDHGTWIPLDKVGDEKALSALKATKHKDHIRVNVTGEKKGDLIQVSSLTIAG